MVAGYPSTIEQCDPLAEASYRTVLYNLGLTAEQVEEWHQAILESLTEERRLAFLDKKAEVEAKKEELAQAKLGWVKQKKGKKQDTTFDPLAGTTGVASKPKKGGKRKPVPDNQGSLF